MAAKNTLSMEVHDFNPMMDVEIQNYMKNLNLDVICRTCLSECDEMTSVYIKIEPTEGDEIFYVFQILMKVASIQVTENDELPTLICKNCIESANNAFKFKLLCERSESLLQTYLKDKLLYENNDDDESAEYIVGVRYDANIEEMVKMDHNYIAENIHNSNTEFRENEETKTLEESNTETTCLRTHKTLKIINKVNSNLLDESSNTIDDEFVDRPHVCKICRKMFVKLKSLKLHMRNHTEKTPYKCTVCDKRYRQSRSLKAHMYVHTGQRPFVCSVCGKAFRQAPDLRYHMRTHTKEKPYMCNVCGKRMSMQCHLVQHMRTHTGEKPYECEECGKCFASSTRLKRHSIIHTDIRPFECEVCNKNFNRSSTLKVHLLTHAKKKPFSCEVCGKGFIKQRSLKSHSKTHDVFFEEVLLENETDVKDEVHVKKEEEEY